MYSSGKGFFFLWMETLKMQGKQTFCELTFFLPTDCAVVLIMLKTRKIAGQLSL